MPSGFQEGSFSIFQSVLLHFMEGFDLPPNGLFTLDLEGDAPFTDALLKENGDSARHGHP